MAQLTIERAFDLATQYHKAGQLGPAEQLYRKILARQPQNAIALNMLGVIAFQTGRYDAAVDLLRQAVALRPNYAGAHSNLGMVLTAQGQLPQAIAAYQQAIALNPTAAEFHVNLGNALKASGKLDEAIAAYRQAIRLNPDYADAHGNLGVALEEAGHLDDAVAAYQQASALKPQFPDGYNTLGNALSQQDRPIDAIVAYRRAIALNPNYADAYSNLGNALREIGQVDEAISACRHAIALKPDLPQAHNNLGNALQRQGRTDDAIAAYRQAVALDPSSANAQSNLGKILGDAGRLDEAVACCHRAIALKPDLLTAHNNLGNILCQQGRLDEAIATFRQALALRSDVAADRQSSAPSRRDVRPETAYVHSNLVYTFHFHSDYDAARLLEESKKWAAQFEAPLVGQIRPHDNNRDPERRLKIGYVSPDFRAYAGSCFSMPLLAGHDPRNVEVYCYSSAQYEDAITAKFKQLSVIWRNCLALSDGELAEAIRHDGIDVLIDLTLHMANNRLLTFARKPAPVQVTWLGYPGTTGLSSMDYRLTDPYLDPIGQTDQFYTERSIRLAKSFFCYQPLAGNIPDVNDLPALANGYITFGCFNNFMKVTPQALRLWMQVLHAVAYSRFIVQSHTGSHRDAVRALFQQNGIAPHRLEFVPRVPPAQYFGFYHRVDLCLDPLPYPGHTSTLDALWMGVPTVTLSGATAASRGGVSIFSNLDLPEFIALSGDQYVSIAAKFSGELEPLRELRRSLRARLQASTLMDGRQFAADFESAYRRMWRNWCASGNTGAAY